MDIKTPGEKARELVQTGAEIAGGAVGGAIGFLAAGPTGAAGAGVLGVVVTKALAQVADKVMAAREKARVGSVAAIALARIAERAARGDAPNAAFFSSKGGLQSDGAQLLEGVLLKARDEYEELKLYHLGRFYGNLAFTDISPRTASLLVKTFEMLTFRQLALLSLIDRMGKVDVKNLRSQSHADPNLEALKREEMELHDGTLGSLALVGGAGPFDDALSSLGRVFSDLAEISSVPDAEVIAVQSLIASCPENSDIQFHSSGSSG